MLKKFDLCLDHVFYGGPGDVRTGIVLVQHPNLLWALEAEMDREVV